MWVKVIDIITIIVFLVVLVILFIWHTPFYEDAIDFFSADIYGY